MNHLRIYGFSYLLLLSVFLGSIFPMCVDKEFIGNFKLEDTYKWGLIGFIFFLQGFGLSRSALLKIKHQYKSSFFVLIWNFLGVLICFCLIFMPLLSERLILGFLFLSILPTTIALSVSYTDLSHGNVPLAVLTTCLSNLIGSVLFPISFTIFYGLSIDTLNFSLNDFLNVFRYIFILLILPLCLGYLLRYFLNGSIVLLSRVRKILIEIILLIIVFNSFIACFSEEMSADSLDVYKYEFFQVILYAFLLFLLVNFLVWKTSFILKLDTGSRIAFFFSASQKSICSGIPLILLTHAALSIKIDSDFIILPLICYYFFQTLIGAILIKRFKGLTQNEIL